MAVRVGITGSGASAATSCGPRCLRRHRLRGRQRPDHTPPRGAPAEVRLGPRQSAGRNKGTADGISVDSDEVKVLAQKDPAQLPWKDLGVDVVFECTGIFTNREGEQKHLDAAREEGDITAPPRARRVTWWLGGVTTTPTSPSKPHIISNASCTTNCLGLWPVDPRAVWHREGVADHHTLLHQRPARWTSPHKDLRRPGPRPVHDSHNHGAATAVGEVLPQLKGKLDGFSMRVPTSERVRCGPERGAEQEGTGNDVNDGTARRRPPAR